ncbi:hypothetical protein WH47_03751 [Habropoda laboriosa]|uniref:Uncharacterized protein n=1 Tax=Habropoda laboriosa TaxID=597456 RepID=A0A0L7QVX5_9HYME|nr:hypothetical protein WH47_03751 [Habropoda laboriosa]
MTARLGLRATSDVHGARFVVTSHDAEQRRHTVEKGENRAVPRRMQRTNELQVVEKQRAKVRRETGGDEVKEEEDTEGYANPSVDKREVLADRKPTSSNERRGKRTKKKREGRRKGKKRGAEVREGEKEGVTSNSSEQQQSEERKPGSNWSSNTTDIGSQAGRVARLAELKEAQKSSVAGLSPCNTFHNFTAPTG